MAAELKLERARICVVLLTGLGDVVNGLPLVNAIKDRYPGCRITWVVEPMPAPVLQPHPAVDRVVVYRKKDGVKGVRALRRDLRAAGPFDLAINLNVFFKSVWPTMLSGAPVRMGFDRGRSFDQSWVVANRRLPARPRAHTADMFLEFLEPLGIPMPEQPEWRIPLTGEERAEQRDFLAGLEGRPLAALIPASAVRSKDWIPERWARVADALAADFGYRVVLVGGRGERETAAAAEILRLARIPPLSAMGDPIRRMLWMLEGSALALGPDTGPLHLARALGTPVIGLYGRTSPWRVGPYRAYQDLWVDAYTDPGEAPDPSSYTPRSGRMEQITVEQVLARVQTARDHHGDGRTT